MTPVERTSSDGFHLSLEQFAVFLVSFISRSLNKNFPVFGV